MGQSITIDVQARIVGYQESLKQLQQALNKVDPGSEIGKNLTKAFTSAQAQVKELSKNMFPKASNEFQIDKILGDVDRVGMALDNVRSMFSGVSLSDLKLNGLTSEISNAIREINTLQNSVTNTMNTGIRDAVSNSSELKSLFSELGKDITQLTPESGQMALAEGLAAAREEAENASQALEKARIKVTDLQNDLNDKKANSPFNPDTFNLKSFTDQLKQASPEKIFNKDAFSQLWTSMIDQVDSRKLSEDVKTQLRQSINSAFETLNNDNTTISQFRQTLTNLYQQLSSQFNLSDNQIRGILGTTDPNKIIDQLFGISPDALQAAKDQITKMLDPFRNQFTKKENDYINKLIDEGKLEKATEAAIQAITRSQEKVAKTWETGEQRITEAQNKQKEAEQAVITANQKVESYDKGSANYNQVVSSLMATVANQTTKIAQLETQVQQLTQAELNKVQNGGGSSGGNLGLKPALADAQKYKSELNQINSAQQAIGKMQSITQRWFSVYAAVRMVTKAIKNTINTTKELDATITDIAIVTNMSQDQLWGQMPQYTEMARQYGASISGVYKVSQLYYQQGLKQNEVMALSAETLKMARISGLEYSQATDYMTNAVRSFKMEMTDAQVVTDVYSAVAAKSATSVSEIATAMSKTASSAQAVGSSIQNTTAMMAVMIEATRESPENIGSAMKSIISRYGELKENKTGIDEEGEEYSLNKVDKALQSVGLTLHDSQGEFRNFDEVIMELAESWDTIDTNTQRYIATVMAGNRQQSRFLALVSSYQRLKELSAEAADSEDASQMQFLKTIDSIEYKSQQLQTSLQSLYTDSGIQNLIKDVLDGANNIVQTFTSMPKTFDMPLAAIAKFGIQFANIAKIVTTTFGLIKTGIASQIDAIRQRGISGAQQAANQEVEIVQQKNMRIMESEEGLEAYRYARRNLKNANGTPFTPAQAKQYALGKMGPATEVTTRPMTRGEKIKNWFSGGRGTALAGLGFSIAGSALTMGAMSMSEDTQIERDQKALTTLLGSAATGAGMGAMFGVPGMLIGGLVGTVSGLIQAADIANEDAEEKAARLKKELETAKNENISKKNEFKTLKNTIDEYERLKQAHLDSAEAAEEYREKCNAIAEEHPDLISGYDSEGNAIVNLAAAYERLKVAKSEANASAGKEADKAIEEAHNATTEAEKVVAQAEERENIASMLGRDSASFDEETWVWDQTARMEAASADTSYTKFEVDGKNMHQLLTDLNSSLVRNQGNGQKALDEYTDILGKYSSLLSSDAIRKVLDTEANGVLQDIYAGYDALYGNKKVTQENQGVSELDQKRATADMRRSSERAIINSRAQTMAQGYIQARLLADEASGISQNKYLSDFSSSGLLAGRYLAAQYNTADALTKSSYFEKQSEADFKDFTNTLSSFWNQSYTAQKEQLNNLIENQGSYTQQETSKILSNLGITADGIYSKIYDSVMSYYSDLLTNTADILQNINESQKKRDKEGKIGKKFKDGARTVEEYRQDFIEAGMPDELIDNAAEIAADADMSKHFLSKLGENEKQAVSSFYNKILDKINDTTISESTGEAVAEAYVNTWKALTSDKTSISDTVRDKAQKLLSESDFTSSEGISDFINGLTELGTSLSDLGLDESMFDNLKFPENFSAKAQAFADTTAKSLTDFDKDLSNVTKGMNYSEAASIANKLNVSLTKFRQEGNKFFLDDYSALEEHYFEDHQQAIKDLDASRKKELGQLSSFKTAEYGTNIQDEITGLEQDFGDTWSEHIDELFNADVYEDFANSLAESEISSEKLKTQLKDYAENRDTGETFLHYVERKFQDDYDAYVEASDKALQASMASSYLSSGQIEKFVATARGTKSTDYQKYYKEAIEKGTPASIAETIAREQVRYAEEWNKDNDKIAEQIASGDYQNLSDNLMQYQGEIYKQYKGVQSSTANALLTAMKGGETQIEVTSANRKYLTDLASQEWITEGTYDVDGQLKTGTLATINTVELMSKGETEFNAYIQRLVASREEKLKLLQDYQNIKYPDKAASISDMISKTELSRAEFQSYLDSIGIEDWTDATKLAEYESSYGLEFDASTGKYKQNYDQYIVALQKQLDETLDTTSETYKELSNQLDQAKRNKAQEKEVNKKKALEDVINNYDSIDASAYDALQSALSLEEWEIIDDYMTPKGAGTYGLNVGALKDAIDNGVIELSDDTAQSLLGLFTNVADNYLKNITTATSLVSQGTTNQADMQKFITSAKQLGIDAESAFSYDSLLNAWTLNAATMGKYVQAQAQQLVDDGLLSPNEVNDYVNKNVTQALASSVDIKAFLDAENKQGQARQKLSSQLLRAGLVNKETQKALTETEVESIISTIEGGGIAAVGIMKSIATISGKELTSAEIESAYKSQVSQIEAAFDQLVTGPGGIVTGQAKKILETLQSQGKASITALDANNAIVNSITDIGAAYEEYYNVLAKSGEATVEQLNNAMGKMLETRKDRSAEAQAISALSDASGMTYSTLAQIFTESGIQLTKSMVNQLQSSNIIQDIGGGKLRIQDFTAFAKQMNWNFDSEEYVSAFKTYNDNMIEHNKKVRDSIIDEVKPLQDATFGDQVNLTNLETQLVRQHSKAIKSKKQELKLARKSSEDASLQKDLQNELNELQSKNPLKDLTSALKEAGAILKDGILTITDDADLSKVAQAIANAASGLDSEISAGLLDVVQSISAQFTETINKGITGGMTFSEAAKLIRQVNNMGGLLNSDSFYETADGLQLSSDAAIGLYDQLQRINKLEGTERKKVYDTLSKSLKENNGHYKTATSLLSHLGDLQKQLNALTGDQDELHESLKAKLEAESRLAKEMALQNYASGEGFDFMSNNQMPGSMMSEIDYYSAWGNAMSAMKQWSNTGRVDPQQFRSLIAHVIEMADANGETITFLGKKLGGSEGATLNDIDSVLMDTLQVDEKGAYLSSKLLQEIGFNIKEGTKTMDKNNIWGQIDKYWEGNDEQVKGWDEFIDGLISAQEEMQQQEKTPEDFFKTNAEGKKEFDLSGFTDFLAHPKNNKALADQWQKTLSQIILEGETESLGDILKSPEKFAQNKDKYTKAMEAIFSMMFSDTWDPSDPYGSLGNEMNKAGLNGQIQVNGNTIISHNKKTIIKNKEGKYVLENGQEFDSPETAIAAENEAMIDDLTATVKKNNKKNFEIDSETGDVTEITLPGNLKLKVKKENGKFVEFTDEHNNGLGTELDAALNTLYQQYQDAMTANGQVALDPSEWLVQGGILSSLSDTAQAVSEGVKDAFSSLGTVPIKVTPEMESDNPFEGQVFTIKVKPEIDDSNEPEPSSEEAPIQNPKNQIAPQPSDLPGAGMSYINQPEAAATISSSLNEVTMTYNLKQGEVEKPVVDDAESKVNYSTGDVEKLPEQTAEGLITWKHKIEPFTGELTKTGTITWTHTEANSPPAGGTISGGGVHGKTGTVGLAHAKSTLMGELGPEMVVQGNRYFVVGQNGPEFVDLADDAIVFNHLQTRSLLEKGTSNTRGKVITNERNAVAYAHGSVSGGPAANTTIGGMRYSNRKKKRDSRDILTSDIGNKAKTLMEGLIKALDKWYNLLQEIAKIQAKLNKEEALRAKIQSDLNKSGTEYYKSQKRSIAELEKEVKTQQELVDAQKKEREKRVSELKKGKAPFSKMYEVDEDGQVKMKSKFKSEYDKYFGDTDTGKPKKSIKEQYDWLKKQFGAKALAYDSNGKEIEFTGDEKKDKAAMKTAVEAALKRMEAQRDEVQGLTDSINDHEKALLEAEEKRNELLQAMRDNQISLENKVLDAIVDMREREIEEQENLRDAIEESANKFIDGLSNALNKERQMYEMEDKESELRSKQRRLAVLQRTGGSGSEIASLESEIESGQRDLYFDKQQEQIDSIKEASDKEIERMDLQIDIMKEQLEYEKAHGLLWNDVYTIMQQDSDTIANFIMTNDSEWWNKSAVATQKDLADAIFEAEQWKAFVNDLTGEEESETESGDQEESSKKKKGKKKAGKDTKYKVTYTDENGKQQTRYFDSKEDAKAFKKEHEGAKLSKYKNENTSGGNTQSGTIYWLYEGKKYPSKAAAEAARSADVQDAQQHGTSAEGVKKRPITRTYKEGGLNKETGPAILHGTKAKPEAVLTAHQTSVLRDKILSRKPDSLMSLLTEFQATASKMASGSTYSSIDRSATTSIGSMAVNMNVKEIANDYDAKRAGEQAMEEMLRIARKTNVTSLRR